MPIALDSFHALDRFVAAGDDLPAGDPIVKRYPSLFEDGAPAVEQATAAPGEKRTRTRKASA